MRYMALKTILAVDDDDAILRLYRRIFSESPGDFIVHLAHDGGEALEFLSKKACDCVVLDLYMPRMNGFEVLRWMRSSPKWKDIPVVIVTGSDKGSDGLHALLHADDYITKPFQFEIFVAKIEKLLGRMDDPESSRRGRTEPAASGAGRPCDLPAGGSVPDKDAAELKPADAALEKDRFELKELEKLVEDKRIAFRQVVSEIEFEKSALKEAVIKNVNEAVLPILKRMKLDCGVSCKHLDLLEKSLKTLTSSFGCRLTEKELGLTPKEIEICGMIRSGLATKEIAGLLYTSPMTIDKHRNNIRGKLGLSNKDVNLASFLQSL